MVITRALDWEQGRSELERQAFLIHSYRYRRQAVKWIEHINDMVITLHVIERKVRRGHQGLEKIHADKLASINAEIENFEQNIMLGVLANA